jgi:N-acetyl-gamma-glutamylphosphate reductase
VPPPTAATVPGVIAEARGRDPEIIHISAALRVPFADFWKEFYGEQSSDRAYMAFRYVPVS